MANATAHLSMSIPADSLIKTITFSVVVTQSDHSSICRKVYTNRKGCEFTASDHTEDVTCSKLIPDLSLKMNTDTLDGI